MPSVFDANEPAQLTDELKLRILCMLLVVTPMTPLPLKYYKDLVEVEKFIRACCQRFDKVMKSVIGEDGVTMDKVLRGYYAAAGDGKVETIFKTPQGRLVKVEFGDDADHVLDPFDLETGVQTEAFGRKMVLHDLKDSFAAEGVAFPVAQLAELVFCVAFQIPSVAEHALQIASCVCLMRST